MNQELDEKYIVARIEAALIEELTPLAVRKFFPLSEGEPETPELRERMANIKARMIVAKLAEIMRMGLIEDGVLKIENFMKLEGSHRLVNKAEGKPGGALFPLSVISGPVMLSRIVERRIEATEVAGNYHGEALAASYEWPNWNYVSWPGGSSPGLGGNNEDSPIGYFRVRVKNAVLMETSYGGGAPIVEAKELLHWVLVSGYISLVEGGAGIKLHVTDGELSPNVIGRDSNTREFFVNPGGWSEFENTKIGDFEQREIVGNEAYGERAAKAFIDCYPRAKKVQKVPVGSAGNFYIEEIKWVELEEYVRLWGAYKNDVIAAGKFWPEEDRKKTKAWSRLSVSFAPAFESGIN